MKVLERVLDRKLRTKNRALYYAFTDLEKAFDRIPGEMVRRRLKAVARVHDKARTVMRTKHQGLVLSPSLFACEMEALTQEVRGYVMGVVVCH